MTPLLALLGLCLLVVTLCYMLLCAASPWGTCRALPRRGNRDLPRCDGTGMRPRLAWQAYAYLLRAWKDSAR